MLQVAPESFEWNDFSLGLNWANTPDALDPREVLDCKNFSIAKTKGLEKRSGCTRKWSTTAGTSKDVLAQLEYLSPAGERRHLVAIDTKLRCYYGSQWNDIKTGLTTGIIPSLVQSEGMVYFSNGVDDSFKVFDTGAASSPLKTSSLGLEPPTIPPTVSAGAASIDAMTGRFRYKYAYVRWQQAFRVYVSATDATAGTIAFDGTTITGVITTGANAGTLTIDTTAAAYDTLSEIYAQINDNWAGWTIDLRSATAATFVNNDASLLLPFSAVDCLGKDIAKIMMLNNPVMLTSNPSGKSAKQTLGHRIREEILYDCVAGTKEYTGQTTVSGNVVPGSVQISYRQPAGTRYAEDIRDTNEASTGTFEGEGLDKAQTNTINYTTGAISLYFTQGLKVGSDVTINYETGQVGSVVVKASADPQVCAIAIFRTTDLYSGDVWKEDVEDAPEEKEKKKAKKKDRTRAEKKAYQKAKRARKNK